MYKITGFVVLLCVTITKSVEHLNARVAQKVMPPLLSLSVNVLFLDHENYTL
jgi:hypothetical protein